MGIFLKGIALITCEMLGNFPAQFRFQEKNLKFRSDEKLPQKNCKKT